MSTPPDARAIIRGVRDHAAAVSVACRAAERAMAHVPECDRGVLRDALDVARGHVCGAATTAECLYYAVAAARIGDRYNAHANLAFERVMTDGRGEAPRAEANRLRAASEAASSVSYAAYASYGLDVCAYPGVILDTADLLDACLGRSAGAACSAAWAAGADGWEAHDAEHRAQLLDLRDLTEAP